MLDCKLTETSITTSIFPSSSGNNQRQRDHLTAALYSFVSMENQPKGTLLQLSSATQTKALSSSFYSKCSFSPNTSGPTSFLALQQDSGIAEVFSTGNLESKEGEIDKPDLTSSLFTAGERIYDAIWWPSYSIQEPYSQCYMTSIRGRPIQCREASTGKVRCSYICYDNADTVLAPISLCFNLDGSRLYGTFENRLQFFDTCVPGNTSSIIPTTTSRKARDGQKGLLSCMSFSPDYSGMYAVGSFSSSAGLYDARLDDHGKSSLFHLLSSNHGILGPVTQVQWSPSGTYLYIACRKSNSILCWDVRQTGEFIYRMDRPAGQTNQRLIFDIEKSSGRNLVSGDESGNVVIFDTMDGSLRNQLKLDSETVGCVSINPQTNNIMATAGERRYPLFDDSQDETSMEDAKLYMIQGILPTSA